MSRHETNPNKNRIRTAEAATLSAIALLGGVAAANANAVPAESLQKQRTAEQRAFGGIKALEAQLPLAIETALSAEGKHFKPGKTAKYSMSVGAGTETPNVYDWTTMQMSYVKGKLKTVMIIDGLDQPAGLRPDLSRASYTRLDHVGKGFRYTRQMPEDNPALVPAIVTEPIPSLAELPEYSLADRRDAVKDLNRVQVQMQGVLTGYAKAGPAPAQ